MDHPMQELMNQKIWVLWKKVKRRGKITKVPIAFNGGASGTSANWSHTWCTYEKAVTAKEKIQEAAGIGFIIPKGYFFLDKDDADIEDTFVKTLLARFDSYAEKSVSGTGAHIYGKCNLDKLPLVYN